jgi:hypothetical protein
MVLEKLTKYFLPALNKNDNNNVNSGAMKIVVEYTDAKEEEQNGNTGPVPSRFRQGREIKLQ